MGNELKNLGEIIEAILLLCDEIGSMVDNNQINFEIIVQFIDSLSSVNSSIDIIGINEFDLQEYNDKLNSALAALEDKDYDMFGDIIRFELKPIIESWKDRL